MKDEERLEYARREESFAALQEFVKTSAFFAF
jgi:hypothetical protein